MMNWWLRLRMWFWRKLGDDFVHPSEVSIPAEKSIPDEILVEANMGEDAPKIQSSGSVSEYLISLYMSEGEGWEMDQRKYSAAWANRKPELSDALDQVDIEAMVAGWEDDTIKLRHGDVSNLAFNVTQNERIVRAIHNEFTKRFVGEAPATHGIVR